MVLYIILAIIVIILIAVGVLFYLRSNKRQIIEKAIERKTGARGLRSIIEEALIDIMYDVPSSENVSKVVITEQKRNTMQ